MGDILPGPLTQTDNDNGISDGMPKWTSIAFIMSAIKLLLSTNYYCSQYKHPCLLQFNHWRLQANIKLHMGIYGESQTDR